MVRSVLYTLAIKKDRGEGEREGGTGEEREREDAGRRERDSLLDTR